MGLFSSLTNFDEIAKLPEKHPLRQQFEAGLSSYLSKTGRTANMKSQGDKFDVRLATAMELREMATNLVLEANRIELLPNRKTMYVIRQGVHLMVAEPSAEKARFWAFKNGNPINEMFEEMWAQEEDGKWRCIARKQLNIKED